MRGEDDIRKGLRKTRKAFNINLGGDVCAAMADKDTNTRQRSSPNTPYFCATNPHRKGKRSTVLLRMCPRDEATTNLLLHIQIRFRLTFPVFLGEENGGVMGKNYRGVL